MNHQEIINKLQSEFTQSILSVDENSDILTLTVEAHQIKPLVRFLKESLDYIFLTDLCGIHYPEQEKELGIIYHLHNLVENKRIRLKTFVERKHPELDSIVSLFDGANWMERETFDFYGIIFNGHPKLERILNVEFMNYHPMLKEYPLEDATRDDKNDQFFGR